MKGTKTGFLRSLGIVSVVSFSLVFSFATIMPTQTMAYTPVAGSIVATPDTIDRGESTQLKWNSFNATHISISPGVGNVAPSGSTSVSPTQTTTYTLTISNDDGGFGTGTATVYVQSNPPSVDLTADDTSIDFGASTTLRWNTSGNPTSCVASNGWSGSKNVSGGSQSTGTLTSTRTFRIDCSNSAGSDFDSVTVTVGNQPQPPSVDISADDTSIDFGASTTLRWNTSGNPTSCTASNGWSGSKKDSEGGEKGEGVNRARPRRI